MPKFVFVTGGVLSSLGKGLFASSTAKLLSSAGVKTSAMKIDPYLNSDAGTLNPFEHGEVFVTQDGHECDLDVGNYERFLGAPAKREQNLMMGSVYKSVVEKERRGDYLGKTVQLIPHATNEIRDRIEKAAAVTGTDVLVVEIGGTVGDIESEVVLEAVRQMRFARPAGDVVFVHLALVPTILTGEQKTKPLQHSVRTLLSKGITPDFVVARSDAPISEHIRDKIHWLCSVRHEDIFCSPNVALTYELPLTLDAQGFTTALAGKLDVKAKPPKLDAWRKLIEKARALKETRRIAVVGKYAGAKDAYNSVFEALLHAGIHAGVRVNADLVDSEALEKGAVDLTPYDGILVPGGFGGRGVEGKIAAIRYARENNKPFLGICYGLQLAVIEISRDVLNLKDANSTEIDEKTPYPVIDILPEQKAVEEKGGTMRLGAKQVLVEKDTKAFDLYKGEMDADHLILKRFRHRYEVNPEYVERLEKAGITFSGRDPHRKIMKILELPDHSFFMGTQAHPEFDSRFERPEPLYYGFVQACRDAPRHA